MKLLEWKDSVFLLLKLLVNIVAKLGKSAAKALHTLSCDRAWFVQLPEETMSIVMVSGSRSIRKLHPEVYQSLDKIIELIFM
jgi:hypothetical protein